jgi:hypothetical protein
MSAAVQRLTSGPIDPDLEQALPELAMAARRLRQVESIIRLPESGYDKRAAMITERADLFGRFETRAEKLGLPGEKPGRALLMMVEEANRLYDLGRRRKPSLAQVLASMEAVSAASARDLADAEVEEIGARYRAIEARRRSAAADAAVQYLEACGG